MEIKKSEHADLERGKSTSLLIGFVIALGVMFVALEWTQREVEDNSELSLSPLQCHENDTESNYETYQE